MLRNIHFFSLSPESDEREILRLLNNDLQVHARKFGCIERKTYRFLDAHSPDGPADSAPYIQEALWPDLASADKWTEELLSDSSQEIVRLRDVLGKAIKIERTVRYVDEQG